MIMMVNLLSDVCSGLFVSFCFSIKRFSYYDGMGVRDNWGFSVIRDGQ